ncbi:MAG: Sua5/YciO/YrdC/YwlC family protein [Pseudomonadota bacterium]|nr:Sua5/YciO/YrdC/YwlC family protein [Pseudomonadota bacterium]
MTPWHLRHARRILRAGGVIAYPTEGVFGLGCDPGDESAVQRIIALKGRSWRKGLILLAAYVDQLRPYLAPIDTEVMARMTALWPGPYTWVVPAAEGVSPLLTGGTGELAVRVTAHPEAARLCLAADMAVVSTSANPSGRPAAHSIHQVRRYFADKIDYIVPGPTGGLLGPTEIRHALSGRILRAGASAMGKGHA